MFQADLIDNKIAEYCAQSTTLRPVRASNCQPQAKNDHAKLLKRLFWCRLAPLFSARSTGCSTGPAEQPILQQPAWLVTQHRLE